MSKEELEKRIIELQEQRKHVELQAIALINQIDGRVAELSEILAKIVKENSESNN